MNNIWNESDLHITVCGCVACSGQSNSTQSIYDDNTNDTGRVGYSVEGLMPSVEQLVMPGGAPGYVKSLFGTDQAVWSNGGAGTAAFGNAISITYTFQDVAWGNPFSYAGESLFNGAQQAVAVQLMQLWSNMANITFVAGNAGNAKMAFNNYDLPPGVGGEAVTWSYNDNGGGADRIAQTETTMDISSTGYVAGQYGWLALMHEIGHSLGLKHPGNYNAGGGGGVTPYLTDFGLVDTRDFSVMSYYQGTYANGQFSNDTGYPTTPMLYDIAAIQYLYGANTSYNSGNTTYTLTTAENAHTRWDGGGSDTLNASAVGSNVTLDLREGEGFITHVGDNHSWNAFGANIENATGGTANDTITGNSLNNILIGNAGNDTLNGGTGSDTLQGGAGSDVYVFSGSGHGTNELSDSDGTGTLQIDSINVAGTATDNGGGSYTLVVGGVTFNLTLSGTTLTVSRAGGTTVVNIVNFTDQDLGIDLGAGVAAVVAAVVAVVAVVGRWRWRRHHSWRCQYEQPNWLYCK